jgi:CRISPR-associated protein Csx3
MTQSYQIKLVGDTLWINFNRKFDVPGDRIIQDAYQQLQELLTSAQLIGGSILKINGRASLPIAYLLAHELGHLYNVVAVCDPRLLGQQQNRYVVVISYTDEYSVGDVLEFGEEQVRLVTVTKPNSKEQSTFFASADHDVLTVFNTKAPGNQIAADAAARIDELIKSGQLEGGKLLKINGKNTLLASYVIAHQLQHLYSAIAIFDPKIGDIGIERYIVAIQHGSDHPVGTVIEQAVTVQKTVKVALCGFPGAGKTCLREGLKDVIKNIDSIPDDFCYVISACPDGDTAYFLPTAQKYPEVAKELREKIKRGFTNNFANSKAAEISNIQNPLLIFDVGGKITEHNEIIMSEATHAVILAKQGESSFENNVQPWLEFCQSLKLPVVAIVYSDYHGTSDVIEPNSEILTGTIHHLDRQVNASSRPMVMKLASLLIDLRHNHEQTE